MILDTCLFENMWRFTPEADIFLKTKLKKHDAEHIIVM